MENKVNLNHSENLNNVDKLNIVDKIQCLILAGGLGTRMKTVTGDKPKALLPIGPKTFIDWQLQWLKLLGAEEVIMAIGHGGELIEEHLAKAMDTTSGSPEAALYPQVRFSYDGPVLLGTGGAIKKAAPLLNDDFIVTYGDSFLFVSLKHIMAKHLTAIYQIQKTGVTFSIFKNQNLGDTSNIIYSNGEIIKYDKFNIVPEMKYIDYGLVVVNKSYFLTNTSEGIFDFAVFLSKACEARKVTPYIAQEIFFETGSPSGYERFKDLMKSHDYDLKKLASTKVQGFQF